MSSDLTPLAVCEALIGPLPEIARVCGLKEKAAYNWRWEKTWRAAGDLPSARVQRQLLAHSEAHDLGLTADHLVRGASRSEIEAILAARSSKPMQAAE